MVCSAFCERGGAGRIEPDDIYAVAYLGLCQAAIAFDAEKGIKFNTFAGVCIQNEIRKELRKHKKRDRDVSLYTPFPDENITLCLADTIPDETDCFKEIKEESVYSIVLDSCVLNEKEKEILFQVILEGRRQIDIAQNKDFSQAQISRLYRRALAKLRKEYVKNYV